MIARDDVLSGGSKRRAMMRWLPHTGAKHFVYAGTIYGLAGLALAHVCKDMGYKATVLYSRPKVMPPVFDRLKALGADVVLTDAPMPLAEVEKAARLYATDQGAYLIPPGCDHPDFICAMGDVMREIDYTPPEVWTSCVTGTLCRAGQMAWPDARHFSVSIVKSPNDTGDAQVYFADEKYHQPARILPPYPAFPQCDAKVWPFALKHAAKGALIWNIGA